MFSLLFRCFMVGMILMVLCFTCSVCGMIYLAICLLFMLL